MRLTRVQRDVLEKLASGGDMLRRWVGNGEILLDGVPWHVAAVTVRSLSSRGLIRGAGERWVLTNEGRQQARSRAR